jgi:hypothetical protein
MIINLRQKPMLFVLLPAEMKFKISQPFTALTSRGSGALERRRRVRVCAIQGAAPPANLL